MAKHLRVLILEDSENDALLLIRGLRRGGFEPEFERVETQDAMSAALSANQWDIIISDYAMPRFNGMAALWVLKQSGLDIPFILVSGTIGEDLAVEAMKAGANDYVMKGNLQRLSTAIERELREAESRKDRKRAEERVKFLAEYDSLTNLPNRNLLYQKLETALISGSQEKSALGLLLLDVDRFKEINDTMGHQTGDLLLQQLGHRLRCAVRDADIVARLGGDEFAVLLPGADEETAIVMAQNLMKAMEPPFTLGELTTDARASIGIALAPKHGGDTDTLMRRADIAMYLAKETHAGYAFYSPERDSYNPERLAIMADLYRSIENNQLFLVYQPKIDLQTGRMTSVETLARWQHPKIGSIPPDQFIPIAERTGFIRPLTMWGLDAALQQGRTWYKRGFEMAIGVNLSARTLHDGNLPDQLQELLETHRTPAEHLELEITESAIMADPGHALEILKRISRLGINLTIDDFGTGYSSLAYLKKLPVSAVKIDKSFVMHMTKDDNDAQIVRSTIDLAHNLHLKVIAEGVESREALDRLATLGCDEAQGYFMSRPLPAPEMTKWFSTSPWGLSGLHARTEDAHRAKVDIDAVSPPHTSARS